MAPNITLRSKLSKSIVVFSILFNLLAFPQPVVATAVQTEPTLEANSGIVISDSGLDLYTLPSPKENSATKPAIQNLDAEPIVEIANDEISDLSQPVTSTIKQFWLSDPVMISACGNWPYGGRSHPNVIKIPAGQKYVGLLFNTIENTYGSVSLRGNSFDALHSPLNYNGDYCRAIDFQDVWAGPWVYGADICAEFGYTRAGSLNISQFGVSGPVSWDAEDWFQWSHSGCWSAEIRYIYWGYPVATTYRMNLSSSISDPRECAMATLCEETQDHIGDPINTFTGAVDFSFQDLSMQAETGEFSFQRFYSSGGTGLYQDSLGYGWTHNHDIHLIFPDDETGEQGVVWFKSHSANQYKFVINGDGSYIAGTGVLASLEYDTDHYQLVDAASNIYTFDDTGKILSWANSNGKSLNYEYTGDLLTRVSANQGSRYFDLSYDAQNRIIQVEDHSDRSVSYGYDSKGDLTSFTDVNDQTWTYSYLSPHKLIEHKLPSGDTIVENQYNNNGQVIEQYDGDGNLLFEIAYRPYGLREITYPDGSTASVQYDDRGLVTSRSGAEGTDMLYVSDANFRPTAISNAIGSTLVMEWSADGKQLLAETDPAGNRTEYTYRCNGKSIG